MHRIDTATKAPDLFGAGKDGFKDGDKALGISATELTAAFFNDLQENLAQLVEAGGDALVKGNYSQLLTTLVKKGLQGNYFNVAAAAGTADAITAAYTPAIAALTNGMTLHVRPSGANATATPTFSPDGLAAKTIVKGNNVPLVAGDIAGAGHWIHLQYDATLDKWVLLNPAGGITSRGVQRFVSGGNFTVPAGVSTIYVSGCAGGGGGGGSGGATGGAWAATGGAGGGGSGQHTARQAFSVTPGQVLAVTIGGAGSGGSAGSAAGNGGSGIAGGNTTLSGTGVSLTLTGGGGGLPSNGINGTNVASSPGNGGVNGGSPGKHAIAVASYGYNFSGTGGSGGSGPFGTGGSINSAAYGYGAGGVGATGTLTATSAVGNAGSAGAPGLLIIEW